MAVTTLSGGTSLAMTAPAPTTEPAPDRHPRSDGDGRADPHVILDDDRGVRDEIEPLTRRHRMPGGAQRHPRSDQHPIADGDAAEVEKIAALVDEDPLTECGAQTVVAVERRQNGQRVRQRLAEDLGQHGPTPVEIVEGQRVEAEGEIHDDLHPLRECPGLGRPGG
ncbi:hypothetical protein [Actinoplanes sp. SE50/110]|uniref:hypothetical protein n=1 Tax=Actinoplanes sp. (strain ATCC 31044 / CBS 674.73 / SE50/110) TaxID=134676 RepID=UPI00350F4467